MCFLTQGARCTIFECEFSAISKSCTWVNKVKQLHYTRGMFLLMSMKWKTTHTFSYSHFLFSLNWSNILYFNTLNSCSKNTFVVLFLPHFHITSICINWHILSTVCCRKSEYCVPLCFSCRGEWYTILKRMNSISFFFLHEKMP